MPVEVPEDMLSRSKAQGVRADRYSQRIDTEMGKSTSATRTETNLSWQETRTRLDEVLSEPKNMLIAFSVGALGVGLMILAFAGGGGGRVFAIGLFVALVAAFPCSYIISHMRRTTSINDILLHHNLDIDRQQEAARNTIRANFTMAEIQMASIEANVSMKEMELALMAAFAAAYGEEAGTKASTAYAQDVRNKQQELDVLDKQILLEQAKGQIRVDELEAQGLADLQKSSLLHDLDLRRVKEQLYAEQERFGREMAKLDKEHTQAARMQRISEVTQLRKTLVAAHQELRNNPALADQLTTMIKEVELLEKAVSSQEPMTIEDHQRQQLIDSMLTRFLLKKYGLNDESNAS